MKRAALLINLGSPKSTSVRDVRKYLDEFLMDKRVIDYPYLFRAFLIRGIILRSRPERSAEAYKSIWTEEGSPLIVTSRKLRDKVQQYTDAPVGLAMRYGQPSILSALQGMHRDNPDLEELFVVPLYPQYAMSSYETVVERVKKIAARKFPKLKLVFQPPFYSDPRYISILADSMRPFLDKPYTHLLFSYHGIPERHIRKSDPTGKHCKMDGRCCKTPSPAHATCYRHQCMETTRLVAEKLGLTPTQYSISYQSRLGRDPWLTPFTDFRLREYGKQRMERLVMVTPAFVSDCLETLEEIQLEGVHSFLAAGGKEIDVIPCLNDRDDWAKLVAEWIEK